MQIRLTGALLFLSFGLWAQKIDPPIAKAQPDPEYPAELKYYLTDHPMVELTIDDSGVPFAVKSPIRIPDNVVSAIRKWRFEPARQGSRTVGVTVSMTLPIRRPLSEATGLRRHWRSTAEIDAASKTARDLDEAGAAAVEQKIAQNPEDVQSRLVAVQYSEMHDSPAQAAVRLRHARWFAEIHPTFEWLGSPGATARREQTGMEDYEALRKLWTQKLAESPDDPAILDNATNFLRISDPAVAERALLKAIKTSDHAMELLGELYGFAATGVTAVDRYSGSPTERSAELASTPFAGQAHETLMKTANTRLLFSALNAVSGPGDTKLCNELLGRAKEYYPDAKANCDGAAVTASGETLHIGGTVQSAKLVKPVRPAYPQEAKSRGITGTVKFEAVIGKDGKIRDLELASGPFALYDAARDAVEKWEYQPTKLNGEAVDVITTIDVNFSLTR